MRPCQELADDRKVYIKRGPPISSELCPAAGHLRRRRGPPPEGFHPRQPRAWRLWAAGRSGDRM